MPKVKVAIVGSGNIGTDLMRKLERSEVLEMSAMVGIDPESDGLRKAKERGYKVFYNGIDDLKNDPEVADIVFDATSAGAHHHNAKVLEEMGKQVLDLTPAAIGPFIVPSVNLGEHIHEKNVNLITCGGQATIPIVHAVNQIASVEYAEIVATISSKSAGPGTRANIDEFTQTTAKGIENVGGADEGKAIIILNPAEPPILMRDTVYTVVKDGQMNEDKIIKSINEMVEKVQEYVPGYKLRSEPIIDGNKVSTFLEIEGAGDYLPKYSGNLDIMTASAVKVAEGFAENRVLI
ncbi:MAG TPA: acetaldehyde dehydrogenase (acetylating) [Virgibacillus sp.]|nr:acetaldehyde dehydrogenase (acetylating) [Virgibacillus sp.]HLR68288.1 acetaldehyde dehydrogenase (acetylating) [Virgibacillus sp.]